MSSQYYEYSQSYSSSSRRPITYAVQRLIIANVLVFAATLVLDIPFGGGAMIFHPAYWLAFKPAMVLHGAVWQFVTYMFLHGGLYHLFGNMLGLFFFGPDVERILSTRQFFRFYLLCGVGGVAFELALALLSGHIAAGYTIVGASGAVLGVIAAYAVAYPKREVFLFPIPVPIHAWVLAVFFFIASLTIDASSSGTAWATHAGGMICGFVYMKVMPGFRAWLERRQTRPAKERDEHDPVGEAVDNIFKFDDEKRRRK